MVDLLNELLEIVYVADPHTYELNYMNATGLKAFNIDSVVGKTCYEAIHGKSKPCDFCTNHLLEEGRCYTWRHFNEQLGKYYLLKDKLIDLDGKPARMEVAFDITDMEEHEKRLQLIMQVEQTIMDCISNLHKSNDLSHVIDKALERIAIDMGAERAYLFEIHGNVMNNTYEWCRKGIEPQIEYLQNLSIEDTSKWISTICNTESISMPDISSLREKHPDTYEDLTNQGIKRLVAVPLELDNQLLGYVGVDNPVIEILDYVAPMLSTLGYFISSRIRREDDRRMLKTLHIYDPLTGAMNRTAFTRDFEEIQGENISVGIVCIDINGMKEINDTHGQPYGDQVLIKTAENIVAIFGAGCLYRSGGDEFIVMQQGVSLEEMSAHVRALRPYMSDHIDYNISIGFQWSSNCNDIRQVLSDAEAMMYTDKKEFYQGKPGTRYRHTNDDFWGLTKCGVLEALLAAGKFLVYFQPKVAVDGCYLIGAEALVRMQGNGDTIVAPDLFIPLLEQAHFISLIDFYVFEYVCKALSEWHHSGIKIYPISVNFSRYSLAESDFQTRIWDIWQKYDIPQKMIEIEVTESVEAAGYDFLHVIENIRSAGFSVAIDDFGVKHANLSLFTAIDFDGLKMDKSLVWQLQDNIKARAIVQSVSDICKKMGIAMIAEGVETEAQLLTLQELGCMGAQGFLFSRPIPQHEFEERFLFV